MDVHQASISIAVRDAAGKVLRECIIETKAATVLEFIQGLRGSLWVTFEEGTSAAWLYDLLKPHVAKVVVCDPRKLLGMDIRPADRVLHASNAGTVGIVGQHKHRAANTTIRAQVKCHDGHHWSREIN